MRMVIQMVDYIYRQGWDVYYNHYYKTEADKAMRLFFMR